MRVSIKVPGKLILLGEYAVLEGADALVAAIDRYAVVSIEPSHQSDIWQITGNLLSSPLRFRLDTNGKIEPLTIQPATQLNQMRYSLLAIEQASMAVIKHSIPVAPFEINIDTRSFYTFKNENKLGLGSSAAIIVAIIAAITNYSGADADLFEKDEDLFHLAFATHSMAQGKQGSGIDVMASVFGGVCIYNLQLAVDQKINHRVHQHELLSDLYMLPVWTGKSASTTKLLSQLELYRTENDKNYHQTLNRLIELSNNGCECYKNGQSRDFTRIVDEYFQVLKSFSENSKIPIVSDLHDMIGKTIRTNGGIYKPSGAGEGDFGIGFFHSESELESAKQALARKNFQHIPLNVEEKSVSNLNDMRF